MVVIDTENMTEEQYRGWRISLIDREMQLKCLDPELYDILITLNSKGYYTCQSRAGHSPDRTGYIEFATRNMSKAEYHYFVESAYYLLQELGLKDIRFSKFNGGSYEPPKIEATFTRIGKLRMRGNDEQGTLGTPKRDYTPADQEQP